MRRDEWIDKRAREGATAFMRFLGYGLHRRKRKVPRSDTLRDEGPPVGRVFTQDPKWCHQGCRGGRLRAQSDQSVARDLGRRRGGVGSRGAQLHGSLLRIELQRSEESAQSQGPLSKDHQSGRHRLTRGMVRPYTDRSALQVDPGSKGYSDRRCELWRDSRGPGWLV